MTYKPFDECDQFDLLEIYSRCLNFKDSAKLMGVSRDAWSKKWYECGLPSPKTTRTLANDSDLPYYEIAVVSDTHWGSIYQQKSIFDSFIGDCKDRGIKTLIHCGDIIDGIMTYKDHDKKRFLNDTSEIEDYVTRNYPDGFEYNYFTKGNHDVSLVKLEGIDYDFCHRLEELRSDLTYVKRGTPIIGPGNIILAANHCAGSCAAPGENRTKRMKNRVLKLMSEGQFGHIFLGGHCHNVKVIKSFMNSMIIGVGCFQSPDQYILDSYGSSDICGLILKYNMLDGRPVNLVPEFRYAYQYGGITKNDY